jgi:hypothetical protein
MPKKAKKTISLGDWIIVRTQKFCTERDRDFSSVVEEALDFYLDYKQGKAPQGIHPEITEERLDEELASLDTQEGKKYLKKLLIKLAKANDEDADPQTRFSIVPYIAEPRATIGESPTNLPWVKLPTLAEKKVMPLHCPLKRFEATPDNQFFRL